MVLVCVLGNEYRLWFPHGLEQPQLLSARVYPDFNPILIQISPKEVNWGGKKNFLEESGTLHLIYVYEERKQTTIQSMVHQLDTWRVGPWILNAMKSSTNTIDGTQHNASMWKGEHSRPEQRSWMTHSSPGCACNRPWRERREKILKIFKRTLEESWAISIKEHTWRRWLVKP